MRHASAPARLCRQVLVVLSGMAVAGLVITGTAVMVRVRVAVPVPAAFVALSVTGVVPGAVGVPKIKPVAVLTDNPAGKPVAPKLVGLLVAVI